MSHSPACRARTKEAIRGSGPAGRKRIEDSDKRLVQARETFADDYNNKVLISIVSINNYY